MVTAFKTATLFLMIQLLFFVPVLCKETLRTVCCGKEVDIDATLFTNVTNKAQISGTWNKTIFRNTHNFSLEYPTLHPNTWLQVNSKYELSADDLNVGIFEVSIKGTLNLTSDVNITLSTYTSSSTQSLLYRIDSRKCIINIHESTKCNEVTLKWERPKWGDVITYSAELVPIHTPHAIKLHPDIKGSRTSVKFSHLQKGFYNATVTLRNVCGETLSNSVHNIHILGCEDFPHAWRIVILIFGILAVLVIGLCIGCGCKKCIACGHQIKKCCKKKKSLLMNCFFSSHTQIPEH